MRVGIIVYSHTGHTQAVADRLSERLRALGHECALDRIGPKDPASASDAGADLVVLSEAPVIAGYDCVVLCSPVRGGLPAPPMEAYLSHVDSFEGTRVACLVTGFFPVASWGRDQCLARLREVCELRGATVYGSYSVGWFSMRRQAQIERAVDGIIDCIEH